MDMYAFSSYAMSLLWSRYSIGHRGGSGAHGLGQGINHLVMEMEISFLVQCSKSKMATIVGDVTGLQQGHHP